MRAQLRLDLGDLGYQPRVAGTAAEAQALLGRERVAGVLLDLVLDEGEEAGFELLQWSRARPAVPAPTASDGWTSTRSPAP
jgi:DNA-binding response OmpR family regulator